MTTREKACGESSTGGGGINGRTPIRALGDSQYLAALQHAATDTKG